MMVASWDSYSNNEIMTKVVDFEIYKCTIIHNAAVMLGSNAHFLHHPVASSRTFRHISQVP